MWNGRPSQHGVLRVSHSPRGPHLVQLLPVALHLVLDALQQPLQHLLTYADATREDGWVMFKLLLIKHQGP